MFPQSFKTSKYLLSYFQLIDGYWEHKSKSIILEPFQGYLSPEDNRISVHLPKGVDMNSIRLTLEELDKVVL